MPRVWPASAVPLILAVLSQAQPPAPGLLHQEAVAFVRQAGTSAAGSVERRRALSEAAGRFEALAGTALPPALLDELRKAVATLRQQARGSGPPYAPDGYLALLERIATANAAAAAPIEFQGSYSQPKVA